MPCHTPNYTAEQLRDLMLSRRTAEIANLDVENKAKALRTINSAVSVKSVQASELTDKVRIGLGLEKTDSVELYHYLDNLFAKARTSFTTQMKFVKDHGPKKAKEIERMSDNILKAEGGTRFHWGGQKLIERFIEADNSGKVYKLSELDGRDVQVATDGEIMDKLGINESQFKTLERGIKEIYNLIVQTQQAIDPHSRVAILPEQFVYNPNTDTGSTIDILALYSDGTHSNLDFKTMMPPRNMLYDKNMNKVNLIENPDYIPWYKLEAYHDQLSISNETVTDYFGSKGTRLSRVIPIHVRYGLKPKGHRAEGASLTESIEHLGIGVNSDPMLEHIPVGEMITLVNNPHLAERINKEISRLTIINTNRRKELQSIPYTVDNKVNPKWEGLSSKIRRTDAAINNLILKKDFDSLYRDFGAIIKKLKVEGIFDVSKNLSDVEIDGKPNPSYMDMAHIKDLLDEVRAYSAILDASFAYVEELGTLKEQSTDYVNSVNMLAAESRKLVAKLEDMLIQRELNPAEFSSFDNLTKLNWYEKYMVTLRDQVGMPFRVLAKRLDEAGAKKNIRLRELQESIESHTKELSEFARRNNMSMHDVYNMLINEKTEHLHGRLSSKFWEDFKKAQINNNKEWLDKNLKLKEDWQDIYKHNVDIHKYSNPDETTAQLERWKTSHSPQALREGKLWFVYYDPVESVENMSEGYKNITRHKELLNFYNFWTETMDELNSMLGLSKDERLPKNFLAHIRADVVQGMIQGTFGLNNIQESFKALYQIRESEQDLGDLSEDIKRDPVSGRPQYPVPRYFINPLKDNLGNMRKGLKLRDLPKSLYIYADMALNYHYLKNEVEPHVAAIREAMLMKGMADVDPTGKKRKLGGTILAKITGADIDHVTLFDKMVNYHLYGIKIQDADRKWAKKLGFLKGVQSKIELSLSPLLWMGNYAQIVSNSYFEGHNGYFYKKADMLETQAESMGVKGEAAKQLYDLVTYNFEFSPGIRRVRAKMLSSSDITKRLNWDSAFYGMRKSEQSINNQIGYSYLKTHGLDANGNVVRLSTAPEGTKSILSMMKVNPEGRLTMEGLTDADGNITNLKLYTAIKNAGQRIASFIKGQLNPEDLSAIYMTLGGNAAMGFKTWMPGMIDARFRGLRYDPRTNTLLQGKYTAFLSDMSRDDQAYATWIKDTIIPSLAKFLLHITTFGTVGYKVNETRARALFNKYLQEHAGDPDISQMKFEDYLEYKQGQIKSLAAELTTILSILGMLAVLRSDWDDTGEPLWKSTYMNRTIFRAVNRARREISFFISPGDWTNILRMPAPVMALPIDAHRAIRSAMSGLWDMVTDAEPDPRQRRSKFYPAWRMLPANKLFLMLEADEMSKLREL